MLLPYWKTRQRKDALTNNLVLTNDLTTQMLYQQPISKQNAHSTHIQ